MSELHGLGVESLCDHWWARLEPQARHAAAATGIRGIREVECLLPPGCERSAFCGGVGRLDTLAGSRRTGGVEGGSACCAHLRVPSGAPPKGTYIWALPKGTYRVRSPDVGYRRSPHLPYLPLAHHNSNPGGWLAL